MQSVATPRLPMAVDSLKSKVHLEYMLITVLLNLDHNPVPLF